MHSVVRWFYFVPLLFLLHYEREYVYRSVRAPVYSARMRALITTSHRFNTSVPIAHVYFLAIGEIRRYTDQRLILRVPGVLRER